MVDSDALASLSGVRPSRVAVGVWAVSTFSAGLTGVLAAPIIGLTIDSFTVLIAAAFAAVVAARLRSVGIAVLVGLLMGIITGIVERYLPSSSQFTAAVIPSIPFALLAVFLIYWAIRGENLQQTQAVGGPLDRAISPHGGSEMALARAADLAGDSAVVTIRGLRISPRVAGPTILIVIAAIVPFALGGVWMSAYAVGIAYGVVMLSYTVSAGEGGMIWLCQISFAGIGAFTTAVLATNDHWPLIPAMIVGGLVCGVIGAIVGLLTIRLGNIYVALATLTFGLLVENLVFNLNYLNNFGAGVSITRSGITATDRGFAWFSLIIFVVLALLFENMRRSTFGMAVTAVRWSDPAARTVGLSVLMNKVALSTFAAFIAGIGGALLAIYATAAIPASYATFSGLVWLAVLVTVGVRSISAALIAGVLFSVLPQVFLAYLPTSWGELPPALFGLGAVLVARNPEGTVAMHARQLQHLLSRRVADPRRGPLSRLETAAPRPGSRGARGERVASPGHGQERGGPMSTVLAGENISVNFGGINALTDVSIQVPEQSIVGLIGPNGAGKSTLIGVLSGLLRPGQGRVYLDGADVTRLAAHKRARRGLARTYQLPELYAWPDRARPPSPGLPAASRTLADVA